jgi:hypothetical protein
MGLASMILGAMSETEANMPLREGSGLRHNTRTEGL